MERRIPDRRMYDMAGERSFTALLRALKLKKERYNIRKPTAESDGAYASEEQDIPSKLPEESSRTGSSEVADVFKSAREKATTSMSTENPAETAISQAEQERLKMLERLRKDSPKFKLLKRINVGNLFTICHKHPEFRPLIISMFRLHEFVNSGWNRHEQELLIGLFVKIETLINELVSMKNNPDASSDDMENKFDELKWYISEFIGILCSHRDFLHTVPLRHASYISSSEERAWLEQQEKADVDEYSINELVKPKTYLSTIIDTKYLIRIAHEHPEFRPSVKCALGVHAAMKYLDYNAQVKVNKVLSKVEKYLKKLIHQKYNPDSAPSIDVDRTTRKLVSSINESFAEIMSNLSERCEKSRKKFIECLRCPTVTSFVKNVNVQPQQLKIKERDNPHRNLKGVVAYANYGISQDRLKNLESLFHHLAAKKGAFRHVWLYKTCVNWFEIALLYSEYKSKTRENRKKLDIVRSHVLRRFDEYEEVMAEAREFALRIHGAGFSLANSLSDEIALSGEMEMLSSEAEDYLATLDRLIGHFLNDWKTYLNFNCSIRRSRYKFLTKHQWKAFDFPLY